MRPIPPGLVFLIASAAALSSVQAAPVAKPVTIPPAGAYQRQTDIIVRQIGRAWLKREWQDYRQHFIAPDGRVIDNGNGGASHSEGQGYALLLATIVGEKADFEKIWAWTEGHLFVRPDGLAAWKWDPKTSAVADRNNATDGDLLIAWALLRAAHLFNQPAYAERARTIAVSLGKTVVLGTPSGPVLLPGAFGFAAGDQPDGPIVNLSYYVFPAFTALKSIAPGVDWDGLATVGVRLIEDSRFGPLRLPSDWVSLAGSDPKPAKSFAQTFGYDAIRIPLYLAWAGRPEAAQPRFAGLWNAKLDRGPAVTDLESGAAIRPIEGTGFKLVAALSGCLGKGGAISDELVSRRDDFYYPATLRLLCLAVIQERYAQCL